MTDTMKRAFSYVLQEIEEKYDYVDRIRMLVNVEAREMKGKERDECLDNADMLCAAMELLENARFLIDYVRRKRS